MAEPCEGPLSVVDYGVAEDANKRFRQDMEDGHIAIDGFAGQKDQGFFAVYDGHGGRQVMEYVQEKLHLTVAEELQAGSGDVSVPDALTRAYLRTDKELEERGLTAGGTTSVTTVVQGKTSKSPVVYCANAGDARAVLCRDGVAHRLSYDHKPTDPAERRRVTEMGGTVIRGRVMSVLAVSRALGDIELKPYVTASPYCTATPLEAKDEFLIIACDGLLRHVRPGICGFCAGMQD